jgi:hypothetical protein
MSSRTSNIVAINILYKGEGTQVGSLLGKKECKSLKIPRAPFFRAWLSRVFHHKTMFLSAKCNGKVRVTARKQIIQKPCEYFDKNQSIIIRAISL